MVKNLTEELMKTPDEGKIFKNKAILEDDYEPDTINHRDREMSEVIRFFNNPVENLDIIGPTGSGKSLLVRRMMQIFSKNNPSAKAGQIRCVYINCMDYQTTNKILVELAKVLSDDLSVGYHNSIEIIKRCTVDAVKIIVILDEVDLLLKNDPQGERLLYLLPEWRKFCMINITNRVTWRELITNSRVTSRAPPNGLLFRPYNQEEVFSILTERAKTALQPGSYDKEVLTDIAARASEHGDMRAALRMLVRTAEQATIDGRPKITASYVKDAYDRVHQTDSTIDFLKGMMPQKKLMIVSIYEFWKRWNRYPVIEEVHIAYNKNVEHSTLFKPITLDTIRSYIIELVTYGLVDQMKTEKREKTRGPKPYCFKVHMDPVLFEAEIYDKLKRTNPDQEVLQCT